jgi:hypothetical protein
MLMVAHEAMVLYGAPLCPAGHLPHKEGDWLSLPLSPIFNAGDWRKPSGRPISPPVGEMSGRTEGGNVESQPPTPGMEATR